MRKSKISFEEKMSWWKGDLFVDDTVELAMSKAYRDLVRTIRGFASNPNHDLIIYHARQTLYLSVTKILATAINSQEEFDKLHQSACYELIDSFDDQDFTIGQAQKWINMTFKYLHLLDYEEVQNVYEYCHVPIDSYILNITNCILTQPWSRLNSYREYIGYQKWFRETYPNDIPLDKEFYLWFEENKRQKMAK